MSPNSSSRSSGDSASLNSSISSATFAHTPASSGHSKPTATALREIFCACMSAGKLVGTPSRRPSDFSAPAASPIAASRSRIFTASQISVTSSGVEACASPKICGCRRTIFSLMSRHTSSIVNSPASAAIWLCSTTCSNTSPSSSRKWAASCASMASTAS